MAEISSVKNYVYPTNVPKSGFKPDHITQEKQVDKVSKKDNSKKILTGLCALSTIAIAGLLIRNHKLAKQSKQMAHNVKQQVSKMTEQAKKHKLSEKDVDNIIEVIDDIVDTAILL